MCANVRPEPFYVHENQCTQLLNLLSPGTINNNHMCGSWDIEHDRPNFLFWTIFYLPKNHKKLKFWKTEKNTRRYYHFTQVHNKWQLYNVLFLKYVAWQMEFFVILDCFLPFYPH